MDFKELATRLSSGEWKTIHQSALDGNIGASDLITWYHLWIEKPEDIIPQIMMIQSYLEYREEAGCLPGRTRTRLIKISI